MLTNLLDGWFKFNVGEGAFYSVFGFVFVFLGIAVLILIFTLLGIIMKKVNERKAKKKTEGQQKPAAAPAPEAEDGITPETVAVITAALMAYYEQENVPCDFVVRRIKKL